MSYIIIMKFLSWTFAIMMLIGYSFIKNCEKDLNNPDSILDDVSRMSEDKIIQDYNDKNWVARVAFMIWLGAMLMAIPFRRNWKDDE